MNARGSATWLLVALSLAGCGLTGSPPRTRPAATIPASRAATTSTTRPAAPSPATRANVARADRTGEYPAAGTSQQVIGGWRTPSAAIRAFAGAYINWTAATVSGHLAALAQVSVGQARAIVSLGASQTARDYELRHGGIANAGTVQAIAARPRTPNAYVVVTREQTTSSNAAAYRGLVPGWHVTLATVTTVDAGTLGRLWVLSGWQPES